MKWTWLAVALLVTSTATAAEPEPSVDAPSLSMAEARRWLAPLLSPGSPEVQADPNEAPWSGSSGHLLALLLLHTYRSTLARSDMDLCAFRPSCSHFAQQAIDRFGVVRGVLLGTDRLLRDGQAAAERGHRLADDGLHLLDPVTDYDDTPCTTCGDR